MAIQLLRYTSCTTKTREVQKGGEEHPNFYKTQPTWGTIVRTLESQLLSTRNSPFPTSLSLKLSPSLDPLPSWNISSHVEGIFVNQYNNLFDKVVDRFVVLVQLKRRNQCPSLSHELEGVSTQCLSRRNLSGQTKPTYLRRDRPKLSFTDTQGSWLETGKPNLRETGPSNDSFLYLFRRPSVTVPFTLTGFLLFWRHNFR